MWEESAIGGSLTHLGISDIKTGNSSVFRFIRQSSTDEVGNFSWERVKISLNIHLVQNFCRPENCNFT